MPAPALAYALAAACYLGFQWTIRVVVYPQFARVGAAEFAGHHAAHSRLVSVAVAPLFVALGATSVAAAATGPALAWLAPPLFGVILAVTAFGAVPQHRRLDAGFDARVHRRLLGADSLRLVAALASTALGVALASRG